MADTANHLVTEQGKLRRALAAVFGWLRAMDYSSFDYTLDRIERLEREVGQLKEELRQSHHTNGRSAIDCLTTVSHDSPEILRPLAGTPRSPSAR